MPDDFDQLHELELDAPQDLTEEREPICSRLIGAAGTGKTFTIRKAVADDPEWGLLTSTTGISAVNLGAITLNAALRYFDTASMRDSYYCGFITSALHQIVRRFRRLIVEEYSMMDAEQLQILYHAAREASRFKDVDWPLEVMLVGDLAQLPPVSGKYCFAAECWEHFAQNTTRLEKVWRQDGGLFLDALNFLRAGDGTAAVAALDQLGVKWHSSRFAVYDGTTILPVNKMVNGHNNLALDNVTGKRIAVPTRRWGQQRSEWGQNRQGEWGIPPTSEYKIGAYVMILSNHPGFVYANGDCGHIVEAIEGDADGQRGFIVKLVRTGQDVPILPIVRAVDHLEKPDGVQFEHVDKHDDDGQYRARPHYRPRARRYVTGQIEYLPLRLAYASTVHKTQSLTLDKVQVDFRHSFFGAPAMLYVALSRCRTAEGLVLVGDREQFVKQCQVDQRVLPWI